MTRSQYSQRQKILQTRLMKAHIQSIYNALQVQVNYIITFVEAGGAQAGLNKIARDHYINPAIGPAINALYVDAAAKATLTFKPTVKGIGTPITGFVKSVIAYFADYLSKAIADITNSMNRQMKEILNESIENGWGIDRTVQELKDSP